MRRQKLRSSIKAIQEAVISLKPMNPACSQQSRTDSSRHEAMTVEGPRIGFSPSVISNRLFFSPSMTKSIMEEARARSRSLEPETPGNREATVGDLYDGSVVVVLASDDPYMDFKLSMEEMAAAHEIREWSRLEELLLCYLRLNEERNHKVIMMAFVELVKGSVAELRGGFPPPLLPSGPPLVVSDH